MKPQSRPGCNPGGGSFAPGWSLYSLPGLFSVPPQATPGRWTERKSHSPGTAAHRWTQPPRVQAVPYTHAHSRHRGRTEPRNRARVQGHRQAPKQATEPPTEGAQAQAIHSPGNNTAGNAHKCPTEPPRAGVLSLYYPPPKRPHSGAQSRPQRASRRGYRNAGEGKPTAATAPAQHPGQKSGRFSVIFRAIFCDFSRLCPAPGESFIVESR